VDYYVYALQSQRDNCLYIGISADPKKRLKSHNAGETRSTRSRRPFCLIYSERCPDRISARVREKHLKSGVGREFLKGLIPL